MTLPRIPTDEEYRAYLGGHCAKLWASLDDLLTCPGCKRTKRQLMEYKVCLPQCCGRHTELRF